MYCVRKKDSGEVLLVTDDCEKATMFLNCFACSDAVEDNCDVCNCGVDISKYENGYEIIKKED